MPTIAPPFTVRTRLAAAAGVAAAATLAACGGSAGTSGAPGASSPTATPANQFDRCVVGTWKSTGVSGTISYADVGGAPSVPLTGGAGDVMVIKSDRSFTVDFTADVPQHGTGSDGARYVVTSTGQLGGSVTTSGGRLTWEIANGGTDQISLTKNGASLRAGSLSGQQQFGYACSTGKSLRLTQGGVTYSYVPG